ncbi:polysaccharide biosynthesis/export family protein [Devosia sp. YIM 151766]|uniref:polysaccharide biosynthesis/export family protein n=1 Tax=Devosia sp. YIM 151766 TaxID=3017325 RepID=UPI00255CF7D9|nr:polysaccharide biosynthesis/export family protein [Devosia sp. YIM 151766]WIY54034.1 polysaccharide biosynthesis/export family protein [Devosia sp. YIM 151766]
MRWLSILILALTLTLGGCATNRSATYLVETNGPYQLDTGDVVRVTVYGDAELSKSYRVGDEGAIAFPLVGAVAVRGSTTQDAGKRLARALANGYMRNPDVAVEIEQYRPFYIQGEIKTAGQFPYVPGMSVRAAISTAGGFTETADRNRAVVYRQQDNQMVKGNVELDFPIYPGDTVVVSERWF